MNPLLIDKVILGLMQNENVKKCIETKIPTDEKFEKKLKYVARAYAPNVNEACTGVHASRMPMRSYIAYHSHVKRLKRVAVSAKLICKTRVMKKIWLKKNLKMFSTRDHGHGLSLKTSLTMKLKQLGLDRENIIAMTLNSDAALLIRNLGGDTKHTEISFTVFVPKKYCKNLQQWAEEEKRIRQASDACTLMIIPLSDTTATLKFNFWEPYQPDIVSILRDGLKIGDATIKFLLFFRADLMGQNSLLSHGGRNDSDGTFCIHCCEQTSDRKSGKFLQIREINGGPVSFRELCRMHGTDPLSVKLLNDMILKTNSSNLTNLIEDFNEHLFQALASTSNQDKLNQCFADPDEKIDVAGLSLPLLRSVKISRKCRYLEELNFDTIHFIYCMLHLKIRIVNMLVNHVVHLAVNRSKLSTINKLLADNNIKIVLKDKDSQRNLSGPQCDQFIRIFDTIISSLVPDGEKLELWRSAIEQWRQIITVLSCQHSEAISSEDVQNLPIEIRSWCTKIICLIADSKQLQSHYLHSMMVGHIGEQFTYLWNTFGIPMGLMSLSCVERRHQLLGRHSYKTSIPAINCAMSGKRKQQGESLSEHGPCGAGEKTRKDCQSYFTLSELALHSFNECTPDVHT